MPIPANLDLANSQRAYWNATVLNNNLSNRDMYFKFLQIKTATSNLSIQDMEKIYWNTTAGTTNLSTQDAKRIAFGSANQFEELYWLRAQP